MPIGTDTEKRDSLRRTTGTWYLPLFGSFLSKNLIGQWWFLAAKAIAPSYYHILTWARHLYTKKGQGHRKYANGKIGSKDIKFSGLCSFQKIFYSICPCQPPLPPSKLPVYWIMLDSLDCLFPLHFFFSLFSSHC